MNSNMQKSRKYKEETNKSKKEFGTSVRRPIFNKNYKDFVSKTREKNEYQLLPINSHPFGENSLKFTPINIHMKLANPNIKINYKIPCHIVETPK